MATASLTLIGAFDQRDTASPLITERVDERTLTVLMGVIIYLNGKGWYPLQDRPALLG